MPMQAAVATANNLAYPAPAHQSVPIIAIQTAILHRFGHVLGGDGLGFAQVGDGARQFQNAVVRAGRESHAAHGHF